MKWPKFTTVDRKVGVVGLYRSGKTVFLTSLINHIQNHDADVFSLGRGNTHLVFKHELPCPSNVDRFPYMDYRNALAQDGDWPQKTRTASQYACEFFRSDWRISRTALSLLDLPGERLADIPMAGLNYAAWSDLILGVFQQHAEYRTLAQDYLALQKDTSATPGEIISSYRETLRKLFLAFRPVISPSTFILRPDGTWVGDLSKTERYEHSYTGLDQQRQFTPLSALWRKEAPVLTKAFQQHYEEYRNTIAKPLAKWLHRCDRLVVLVDVSTLLAGGLGMYEGNRELLRHLISFLQPGKGFLGVSGEILDTVLRTALPIYRPLRSLVGWHWGNVARIAFVATKADQVHESQRPNLHRLLKNMIHDLIAARLEESVKLDVEYFVTAAVMSTRSMPDGRLQGRLPGTNEVQAFAPSPVPDAWPADWEHGAYRYPPVAPWMPKRRDAPPDHLDLDRIANFLL